MARIARIARKPRTTLDGTRDSIVLPVFFMAIAVIFVGAIVLVAGVVVAFAIIGTDPFAGL